MNEAARLLRHARRRAGLTQRALAALAGVPQPYVARVESSRTDPGVASLSRLLRACGATLEAVPGRATDADRAAVREALRRPPAERLAAALPDAADLLGTLRAHGVRHVVVGDAAAALHGAPVTAARLDVCPEPSADNAARLARALAATGAGRVGVVERPPGAAGYADVAAGAVTADAGGHAVPYAAIDDLVRMRRAASGPDHASGDGDATGGDPALGLLLALRDELTEPA